MSCDIANGWTEPCKDSIGGIDAVFFVNYKSNIHANSTYDNTDTDLITAIATGATNLYKVELKGNNSFTQKITSSRENGTTFVEQSLTIDMKGMTVAKTKFIKLLAYGRPNVIVKTKGGQYLLAGLNWGMDVTEAGIEVGANMGDFNGYKLTLVGSEKIPANHLNCTTDSGLATLWGVGSAVVTS